MNSAGDETDLGYSLARICHLQNILAQVQPQSPKPNLMELLLAVAESIKSLLKCTSATEQ